MINLLASLWYLLSCLEFFSTVELMSTYMSGWYCFISWFFEPLTTNPIICFTVPTRILSQQFYFYFFIFLWSSFLNTACSPYFPSSSIVPFLLFFIPTSLFFPFLLYFSILSWFFFFLIFLLIFFSTGNIFIFFKVCYVSDGINDLYCVNI